MIGRVLLAVGSFVIVAFGQPAWVQLFGIVAAICGYALFFRFLMFYPRPMTRFWLGLLWGTAVYLVQLSWLLSHPYSFIIPFHIITSLVWGAQFGVLAALVTRERIESVAGILFIAAIWTVMEWSRTQVMSGYSFNPAGLAWTSSLTALQFASIGGIYFLSFWALLTNGFMLRAYLCPSISHIAAAITIACIPFAYGYGQLNYHLASMKNTDAYLKAVLVQTAFPAEEALTYEGNVHWISSVHQEWRQILTILQPHLGKEIDLIVLPEYVVPLYSFTCYYPYESVVTTITEVLGPDKIVALPKPIAPLAMSHDHFGKERLYVSNAYWAQAIANIFAADLIVGLEDASFEDSSIVYSAALHFKEQRDDSFTYRRYAKQILVPMGEYIPFEFCRSLAASYGVGGSFTPGDGPVIIPTKKGKIGPSICYEEIFSDLMRQNKVEGAEVLVNLTSDVWYPDSRLTRQHFDHARLRTVETGLPLIRSCNTGITCALDSLGQVIAALGNEELDFEWASSALYVDVPIYTYTTLYEKTGDGLALGLCFFSFAFFMRRRP